MAMGNVIDCAISVRGSSEMLVLFRREVRRNWMEHMEANAPLRAIPCAARPRDWHIGPAGGHPAFSASR